VPLIELALSLVELAGQGLRGVVGLRECTPLEISQPKLDLGLENQRLSGRGRGRFAQPLGVAYLRVGAREPGDRLRAARLLGVIGLVEPVDGGNERCGLLLLRRTSDERAQEAREESDRAFHPSSTLLHISRRIFSLR
jgi:hypothetical protein